MHNSQIALAATMAMCQSLSLILPKWGETLPLNLNAIGQNVFSVIQGIMQRFNVS